MFSLAGILGLLIIISFIVTIHELGHYSVARIFNTKMDRFSVGFGPVLWSRTDKRGVEWAISAIPLGGYVKFSGDENLSSMSPDAEALEAAKGSLEERYGAGAEKAYFHFKPVWQRFLIVLAGPMANFVLAIALFAFMLMGVGSRQMDPIIGEVDKGSPAEVAGILPGDKVLTVDGRAITNYQDIQQIIRLRANTPVPITLDRGGKALTLTVTPRKTLMQVDDNQSIEVGVIGAKARADAYHWQRYNPVEALVEANRMTWSFVDTNLTYIGRIFTGKEKADQISGLIGMSQGAGQITKGAVTYEGSFSDKALILIVNYVAYGAMISIGVGILNLLPIPVLDGGHLLFYLYEAVARKPVSASVQALSFRIGLASLLGLMLFAAYNDINRLVGFNRPEGKPGAATEAKK